VAPAAASSSAQNDGEGLLQLASDELFQLLHAKAVAVGVCLLPPATITPHASKTYSRTQHKLNAAPHSHLHTHTYAHPYSLH
jgi:hypothetical protein